MTGKSIQVKRLFDLAAALLGLIILTPVVIVVALLVARRLGSPVLFTQIRPGLHGRPFRLLKFRTMTDERGPDGKLLPDHIRLTSFGAFLRSTSLDELPSLVNVLRGEMSLVGPRPLLMEYLPRYSPEQARRHEVRPGLTGLAQVRGRNLLGWEEKFELDVWYVDNRTLILDLQIILETILKVVRREGISQTGHVTARPFEGTKELPN